MNVPFSSRKMQRAFTLVEMLVVMTTLVILIGSVIMANLFGLAMATRQQIWMGAANDSAQAVGFLMSDIRSAQTMIVGGFSNNVFTPASSTSQQSGNALMIATNSTTLQSPPWILYYYDGVSNLIRSNYYSSSASGDFRYVSANPITNDGTHMIFTEVNYAGTPLSNSTVLPGAVSVYLSFTKLQNPDINIETGNAFDLYQVLITVSPRSHP